MEKEKYSHDYKDIVDALIKENIVKTINAYVVYDIELKTFKYSVVDGKNTMNHDINLGVSSSNKVVAAYTVITFPDGSSNTNLLRKEELDAAFDCVKEENKEGWKPFMPSFYKKTAIINHCKTLEKSERIAKVIALFNEQHEFEKGKKSIPQTETSKSDFLNELRIDAALGAEKEKTAKQNKEKVKQATKETHGV